MKKLLILTLAGLLIVGLFACGASNGERLSSSAAAGDASLTETVDENSKTNSEIIEELENEIERLNALISAAYDEQIDLLSRIADLEEELNAVNNSLITQKTIWLKGENSRYLILKEFLTAPYYKLSIVYAGESEIEIAKLNNIWTVKASPNGAKVIFNDYEFEVTAQVFMYDVEKRETNELLMPDLPPDRTAANMEWLDDRYFLFIVMFDQGSVVRGGDVYVYDTETGEYRAIIKCEDYWEFQTESIDIYNDEFIIFNSWVGDGACNFDEIKHHLLTFDEIYDLIENNKTIDLSQKESLPQQS